MSDSKINEYIRRRKSRLSAREKEGREKYQFEALCEKIKEAFFEDWEKRESSGLTLEIQKRAIIGYEKEKSFFNDRIEELISELEAFGTPFPKWYDSLASAVYHENWGLAAMAEWFGAGYESSSSAKIVGENIFFMQNGTMKLMPQKISEMRKLQLIKAFLLLSPEERMDKPYYELYLLDGTRVTIFIEPMAKKGQSAIVFRRYIIPSLSFEEQAKRGTVPEAMIPLFKAMAALGYNVVFMGAVRSAKTTFLSTWQSYEDPCLEGVMVETDPEIPLHKILPGAPVLQLLADGDELKAISKNLLRSDADYFIMAEARDGIALDTVLRIASKGTKRMKITFHSRDPYHFPLEAASEIVKSTGGDMKLTMQKIAASFDYLFHFIQLKDKNQKRLNSIYEMRLSDRGDIKIEELLSYNASDDSWRFTGRLSPDKERYGLESDADSFYIFKNEMEKLSELAVLY